ncbi:zinc finger protein 821 isoform X2 [Esox lucius]|uniref:zinc finger protein 821 isoform X2 n=1 Tax=Esox lucius TaxID=8010 RepID=UPI0009733E13|nr:zinc finger protein 821 isoform X2 [Esox lucius]
MSRRKQTNPFKVNWPFHSTGLSGPLHTINMDGRDDFIEHSECHSNNSQQDSISDSDSDLDNHDSSSNTSVDDHMTSTKRTHRRGVKEESEEGANLMSSYVCPLCTLEFSSPEQLITHVYQHTSLMGSSKSYVCPVCGRALSSPGSLGRHLLIHSEDRLSNCAVCGTRFTDTNNFNREKLREVLNTSSNMECSSGDENCSMSQSVSGSPMGNPGNGAGHIHGPGHNQAQGHGPVQNHGPHHGPGHNPGNSHGSGHNPGQVPVHNPGHNTGQVPGHNPNLGQGHGPGHNPGQVPGHNPGHNPGQGHGHNPGHPLPSLHHSLLSSPPSFPDALSPSSGLPLLPDLLNPMPVHPAGVLLVCNSCVAYQQLVDAQSPMRKWAMRRKNEPVEARMHRLERERTAKKSKREHESPEERELRRLRDREAKRMQRLQETEEQRARRLQRDREAMRMKRANETPDKRQARLIREREAKRLKRRLEKIDPSLRGQIEHDPAAMAALTADMSLFQFPCPMPVPSLDNGLFMKLP